MSAEATPRHSVSVAGAVMQGDLFLAIQRQDNGKWEPPGGVLELDESIEDGLRREVREETGLDVEPERLTGVYKNMSRGIVALVFRCSVVGGSLHTSDETRSYEWISAEEVKARMDETYAVRLLDATEAGATLVRAHDGDHVLGHV